ncbi:MAG: aminotransferase class V-fold PLP-dependent enzyme [Desulfobacterales bacterium]|nr:aminotransferase class V-fold PLP-dependent enzyme [Desulfobacterales bacterium]
MKKENPIFTPPELVADWQALKRTFIMPENDSGKAKLVKYMEQILFGLHDFLKAHVGITEEISLKDLSKNFMDTRISKNPQKKLADVITDLIVDIAPHAVNVASPYFIGHMTSAIPFFMVHLKTIAAALNQNVVKVETSKVVSVLEKQVLAKIHRLIYNKSEDFYNEHVQDTQTMLGGFTEDGTIANLTALWVARNVLLAPKDEFLGIEKEGIHAAYKAYGIERCVILLSKLGHYSLKKACGILGIGNQNVITIDMGNLKNIIKEIKLDKKTAIMAVVGIAGTTETGTVDPLYKIGEICHENNIHFHVDAAWGGPTLLSEKYRHLLKGIELSDSVTIDGHKQFYMPMTCGMVYFNSPHVLDNIVYHSNYVNRPGSVDLGMKSLAGSREANSLILDSALKIMGSGGYALLIDHGIETAIKFAEEIKKRKNFELITAPQLNILTYRVFPHSLKLEPPSKELNQKLNDINRTVQRLQREAGKSFVSRTTLNDIVVLRVVIMNPMTNINILNEILDEQEEIYERNKDCDCDPQ